MSDGNRARELSPADAIQKLAKKSILLEALAVLATKMCAPAKELFINAEGTLFASTRHRFLTNGHTPSGQRGTLVKKGLDRIPLLQQNARILRR